MLVIIGEGDVMIRVSSSCAVLDSMLVVTPRMQ
jgi:hypothetical protein